MLARPVLIGSEIYRRSRYGPKHPLGIPRVSAALDLVAGDGLASTRRATSTARVATPAQLARFHDPAYIAAVLQAEADQRLDPEDAGATISAATAIRCSARCSAGRRPPAAPRSRRRGCCAEAASCIRPAGGTHHGRRERASGFCYFNDPVLGILALLDQGLARILYVDVDAHHGDGVQDALRRRSARADVSIHEDGRWPRTGGVGDRAGGSARNLPVPAGLQRHASSPSCSTRSCCRCARGFAPDAVVLQCGADALADDPHERAWRCRTARCGGRCGALWAWRRVCWCWAAAATTRGRWRAAGAAIWATLNGIAIPARLPPAPRRCCAAAELEPPPGRAAPEHWFTTLADPPNAGPGAAGRGGAAAATGRGVGGGVCDDPGIARAPGHETPTLRPLFLRLASLGVDTISSRPRMRCRR